jgi:hypothetical protein
MVAEISKLVTEYEVRERGMQRLLRFSYGLRMLEPGGGLHRLFFCSLFHGHVKATEFRKDVGLLQKVMTCDSYGRDIHTCRPSNQEVYESKISSGT